jgi:hypothetical protein
MLLLLRGTRIIRIFPQQDIISRLSSPVKLKKKDISCRNNWWWELRDVSLFRNVDEVNALFTWFQDQLRIFGGSREEVV